MDIILLFLCVYFVKNKYEIFFLCSLGANAFNIEARCHNVLKNLRFMVSCENI